MNFSISPTVAERLRSTEEHDYTVKLWKGQIEWYKERESGAKASDVEKAMAARIETQWLLDKAENAMEALAIR